MMHDVGRIERFYVKTLETLQNGKSIQAIRSEAQHFVANHDYDAATGVMKALAEFTGVF
jgi:hypothetical protein